MKTELKQLLKDVKEYIEKTEVQADYECYKCRELEQLLEDDAMPEIYSRVCKMLSE